jgi:hypothetical protein
MDQA